MPAPMEMRGDIPGELPAPIDPLAASAILDGKDGYEVTEADQQMIAASHGQLVGQFLLDRQGIVRRCFTEVPEGGSSPQELMSAASQIFSTGRKFHQNNCPKSTSRWRLAAYGFSTGKANRDA